MHLFYSNQVENNKVYLDESDSRHCTRAMRLKKGDKVLVTDGKGSLFHCIIEIDGPGRVCLAIEKSQFEDIGSKPRLHVAIAPTKSMDRFETFVEKAVEIGVDEITPLVSFHSERRNVKMDRVNKIILAAMKQSMKLWHPTLNEIKPLKDFLGQDADGQKFIGYCDKFELDSFENSYQKGQNLTFLVGPEGDFSKEEFEMAKNTGFTPVSLGSHRYRTETAGIIACCLFDFLNRE